MPSSKLLVRMFLAGHAVAMVTYCVAKMMITACSPNDWAVFYSITVASIVKEWLKRPIKIKSWEMLETILSHLKVKGSFRSLDWQMMPIKSP